jgi:hypothetical protein
VNILSVFNDLIEVIRGIDTDEISDNITRVTQSKSISKLANEGIMQFPLISTRSLDVDTLQMVAKAHERNLSSFVQVALSMNATMNISDTRTPADFVKKFHQNTGMSVDLVAGISDLNSSLDTIISDSYVVYENENTILLCASYDGDGLPSTSKIPMMNRKGLFDVLEHVRHNIINDMYKPKPLYEAKRRNTGNLNMINNDARSYNNSRTDNSTHTINNTTIQQARSSRMSDFETNRIRLDERKLDMNPIHRDMLVDNDVKKSNELVPTLLHVRVRQINDNHENVGILDFIIGVKAVIHPVKSEEIISNLVNACSNTGKFFNFIRWTTGEIGLIKDLLLNIGETKKDVYNRSSGASGWWIALKRRKSVSSLNQFIGKSVLPNATILVTMEEVNYIKANYGFDLFNNTFINKIMSTYFLLGFIIVDASTQLVHFKYDGRTEYEVVSFSGLEKENGQDSRKFKEMLKVINRG